jgi:purine nucleosidase
MEASCLEPIPIIFDCDPGVDDAIMLFVALACPEKFDILGITTVSGNVGLDLVNTNCLKIIECAGRTDIQVYSGCRRPLVRKPYYAEFVHGEDGLGGSTLPEPTISISTIHAVDFLIHTLKTATSKITLSVSGPMTNIAVALRKDPTIADNIAEIVCMGGTTGEGNITKYAEFNFFVDPHAAHIVFTSGLKIKMIGLNVTTQLLTTEDKLTILDGVNNLVTKQAAMLLRHNSEYYKRNGWGGAALHDPCIVVALLRPDLFVFENALVKINHYHEERINDFGQLGESVITETLDESSRICVAKSIKSDEVFDCIVQILRKYSREP